MFDNGVVKIKTIDDGHVSFVVNGHTLKLYHRPISKEDFIQVMSADKALALVDGEFSSPSPYSWNILIYDCTYLNILECGFWQTVLETFCRYSSKNKWAISKRQKGKYFTSKEDVAMLKFCRLLKHQLNNEHFYHD